jgi:hypothetical protein
MKELKNERMKAKGGEQGAGGMGREEGGVGRSERMGDGENGRDLAKGRLKTEDRRRG